MCAQFLCLPKIDPFGDGHFRRSHCGWPNNDVNMYIALRGLLLYHQTRTIERGPGTMAGFPFSGGPKGIECTEC